MSRKPRTASGSAGVSPCPAENKNPATPAPIPARAIPEKTPPVVELAVAKNWRCKNPFLVVCVDAAGAECLLRVPQRARENFRPHLANGQPMVVRATLVLGNLYTLAGAPPRWPGRW